MALTFSNLILICRDGATAYQLAAVGARSDNLRIYFARLADQRAVFAATLEEELAAINFTGSVEGQPIRASLSAADREPSACRTIVSALRVSNKNLHLLNAVYGTECQALAHYQHQLATAIKLTLIQRSLIDLQLNCVRRTRDLTGSLRERFDHENAPAA